MEVKHSQIPTLHRDDITGLMCLSRSITVYLETLRWCEEQGILDIKERHPGLKVENSACHGAQLYINNCMQNVRDTITDEGHRATLSELQEIWECSTHPISLKIPPSSLHIIP